MSIFEGNLNSGPSYVMYYNCNSLIRLLKVDKIQRVVLFIFTFIQNKKDMKSFHDRHLECSVLESLIYPVLELVFY